MIQRCAAAPFGFYSMCCDLSVSPLGRLTVACFVIKTPVTCCKWLAVKTSIDSALNRNMVFFSVWNCVYIRFEKQTNWMTKKTIRWQKQDKWITQNRHTTFAQKRKINETNSKWTQNKNYWRIRFVNPSVWMISVSVYLCLASGEWFIRWNCDWTAVQRTDNTQEMTWQWQSIWFRYSSVLCPSCTVESARIHQSGWIRSTIGAKM